MSQPEKRTEAVPQETLELSGAFGDFELIDLAGRDGPFALYRARQTSLGRPVTLKVLVQGPIRIERAGLLRHEAEDANRLDLPGVIRVFEAGSHGGIPYLVMAGIDGELLSERLKFGPLPSELAVDLALQLAETLADVHEKGLIHGGLRPAAIWITANRHARLGGFGQVIQYDAADLDALAAFAGYLAPEQAGSRGVVGRNTDVYGLGAILYAMLTGRPPHRGASVENTFQAIRQGGPVEPSRIVPTVAHELDIICSRCLHPNPAQRYGTERPLARFASDLRRFQEGKPIRGGEGDLGSIAWLFVRKYRRALIAAALIVCGVIFPTLWDWHRHRSAWQTITTAEASSSEFGNAAQYFDKQRLDRPDDSEAITALALAKLRAGHVDEASALLSEDPSWQLAVAPDQGRRGAGEHELTGLQQIMRVQINLRQGRYSEALSAIQGRSGKPIVPRTAIERQVLSECERLLDNDSILITAIRRGDRSAFRAAAARSPSGELTLALIEKLGGRGEIETRLRCIWLLSRFGKAAMPAESVLFRLASDITPVEPRLTADDPVALWLSGRARILFCFAAIKALDAIDPEWTRNGEAKGIVPSLIESLAREPNPSGNQDSLAMAIAALGRLDPDWMTSAVAARHRAAWKAWMKLMAAPRLQVIGTEILRRLDAPSKRP